MVGTRKGAWIYTSEDRKNWEVSEPLMPGWTVHHMTVDTRHDPPRILAAANHFAWGPSVARSDDGGKTWERRSPGLGFPEDLGITVTNTWHIEPGHPDRPGQVWAGTQPGGLFRSDDWGETWKGIESLNRHPYRAFWGPAGMVAASSLHSIQIDPRFPDRVYVSISTGGTMVSDDAGETWDLCSHGVVVTTPAAKQFLAEIAESFPQPELPPDVDPAALDEFHKFRIDPKNPDRLWGQSHVGVFRSDTRGKWEDVTEGLPSFHGFPIAVTKNDPDAVFVLPIEYGADNFRVVRGQLAVWRSKDAGASWEPLTNGLPGPHDYQSAYREAMDTDGNTPEGVFFGTTNGEVFGSADLGDHWQRLPGTLPPILSVTAAAW
jgi:photosystem II stability/assembly factor-like uncharacterized protein